MKWLFFACFIFMSLFISAQKGVHYRDLPEPVKRFFPVVYSVDSAIEVNWLIQDSVYIALFESGGYPVEVQMKANGFWIITYWEIDCVWVPETVKKSLTEQFNGYAMRRCRISNNPFDEKYYHITLIPPDGNSSPVTVCFSTDGKIQSP